MPKYEVPTLLENMGNFTGIDDGKVYVLQVYVPCGYKPEEVAELINYRTRLVCYYRKFIGLEDAFVTAEYVYINVASPAAHDLPEFRKQIREVLLAEYGKAVSDVADFLRAISACSAGCKFALQYDSMWDVWNAMIDQEQWSYFGYVVNQILDDYLKDKLKPFKLSNLDSIRNMRDYDVRTNRTGGLTSVFAAEYLKSINPFTPPEAKHED